jgi:hypothetical protein
MLRKIIIALCAIASLGMLAPDMALARGGGGGGHGGGGHGGFGGGGGGGFGGRGFGGGFGNSFAHAAPSGGLGAVQGNRFAGGNFVHGSGQRGFYHGRGFNRDYYAGGWWGPGYDDYWDYPDYAYGGYDDGGCYVVQRRVRTRYGWRVRPVQVCG